MKKIQVIIIVVLACGTAFAGTLSEQALKLVPGGTVAREKTKEVKVKTPQETIVEVEFHSDGTLDEASGDHVEKDVFVPNEGLLSLKSAVDELVKQGKTPSGDWSLEKGFLKGWRYEFEGRENGQKYDYVVDAKTGKLLDSSLDD
jgi:uncharacterized membrane protein YkoI